jgi:hypothetical protein
MEHVEGLNKKRNTYHNRYQPLPAEPAQYTICSNTGLCSPEDGHNDARNMLRQKLIINI